MAPFLARCSCWCGAGRQSSCAGHRRRPGFVAAWSGLPEDHPPENRRPPDLADGTARLRVESPRSRVAVSYAVAGGAAAAILFAYLAAAPFIYIDYYGLEEQWFGVLFGVGVVGAWLAQMVNIRYVMTIGYRRIVLVGAFCLAALSTVLWWVTRTDLWGLAGVVSLSGSGVHDPPW